MHQEALICKDLGFCLSRDSPLSLAVIGWSVSPCPALILLATGSHTIGLAGAPLPSGFAVPWKAAQILLGAAHASSILFLVPASCALWVQQGNNDDEEDDDDEQHGDANAHSRWALRSLVTFVLHPHVGGEASAVLVPEFLCALSVAMRIFLLYRSLIGISAKHRWQTHILGFRFKRLGLGCRD